jgi:transaldolase
MKFFLDTANLDEIKQAAALGVLDGITTNPTLVAKEKRKFKELILEICEVVKPGVVNAEVVSTDTAGILKEGREIATWHPNVIVKVPMIPDGIRAVSILAKEGIRTNVTLVFSPSQALLVAKAGASYCSPFLGRLDDISENGLGLLAEIMTIYRAYGYKTEVLAASLRHPMHVVEAAKMGAHIGTMPFKILEQLFLHPLTDKGLASFLKDWAGAKDAIGGIFDSVPAKQAAR